MPCHGQANQQSPGHILKVSKPHRITDSIPLVASSGRLGCGFTQLATSSSACSTCTSSPASCGCNKWHIFDTTRAATKAHRQIIAMRR